MEFKEIEVTKITSNPFNPRERMDREKLKELADTITEVGLVQPIVVRPKGAIYEIISGERRWQASKIAKLEKIPVIIKVIDDNQMAIESLIENVHREDLLDIEKAKFLKRIMKMENIETYAELYRRTGIPEGMIGTIFDTVNMREDLNKIFGPKISKDLPMSLISETRGLEKEDRIKVIEKAVKDDIGSRKIRDVVKVIKKSPEPIKKAIFEDKIDIEDVKPHVERGIPKDMINPAIQEWTKRKKERERYEEAEKSLDKAVLTGELKSKGIQVRHNLDADQKRFKEYEEVWESVRWWSVSSVGMIKNSGYKNRTIECIRNIRDYCDNLLKKLE